MTRPAPMDLREQLLPYHDRLAQREIRTIDLVVIHCTELPDLAAAREYGERIRYPDSGTGNSGHYYIDRDGAAYCWVRPGRVAHHVRGHNDRSIGIELVNRGRWPDWLDSRKQAMTEPYPAQQVDALLWLLAALNEQLPALRWITGHEELDRERVAGSDDATQQVLRKRDPGPLFPWDRVLGATWLARFPAEHEA